VLLLCVSFVSCVFVMRVSWKLRVGFHRFDSLHSFKKFRVVFLLNFPVVTIVVGYGPFFVLRWLALGFP
jgi:hypothetical protein